MMQFSSRSFKMAHNNKYTQPKRTMKTPATPQPGGWVNMDDKIKSLLNQEFLDNLAEIGRLYGWHGDYAEIGAFIEHLHKIYGIEKIDIKPYEDDSIHHLP
jgi:hypothetical protein